jgi:hypothetical protein
LSNICRYNVIHGAGHGPHQTYPPTSSSSSSSSSSTTEFGCAKIGGVGGGGRNYHYGQQSLLCRKNISQRGFLSFLSFTAFSFFRQFFALLLSLASEKRGPTTDKVVKNRSVLARPRPWLTA